MALKICNIFRDENVANSQLATTKSVKLYPEKLVRRIEQNLALKSLNLYKLYYLITKCQISCYFKSQKGQININGIDIIYCIKQQKAPYVNI